MFCLRCGASNPAEATFCAACGAPIPSSTPAGAAVSGPAATGAAAAPALVTQPAAQPEHQLAGLGDRFLAVILDSILLVALFAAIGMAISIRLGGITDSGFSLEGAPALLAMAAALVVGFVYYWLCEGLFGATLGKGMLGLSVRRKDGSGCGLTPSLVRNLLRVVDGLAVYLVGFVVALASSSRQRVGDHLAKTVVVSTPVRKAVRIALVVAWLLVCGAGITGAYLIHRKAPATTARGGLQITNMAFLQAENGPARAAGPYRPGDTVHLKYQVTGFGTDKDRKVHLLLRAVARDPNGVAMYRPWERELTQTVAPGQPVDGSFSVGLRSFVPAGDYRIELKVLDRIRNQTTESAPAFHVDAPAAVPARGLELREFGFSLVRDGPTADPAILQGGGTIFMQWKVFGAAAKDDRVNLHVALKLLGPDGKLVLEEPRYVGVDDEFYYRPQGFCLPMSGHITLPGTFPKGAYTVQLAAIDEVAKAETQHTAKFELR